MHNVIYLPTHEGNPLLPGTRFHHVFCRGSLVSVLSGVYSDERNRLVPAGRVIGHGGPAGACPCLRGGERKTADRSQRIITDGCRLPSLLRINGQQR